MIFKGFLTFPLGNKWGNVSDLCSSTLSLLLNLTIPTIAHNLLSEGKRVAYTTSHTWAKCLEANEMPPARSQQHGIRRQTEAAMEWWKSDTTLSQIKPIHTHIIIYRFLCIYRDIHTCKHECICICMYTCIYIYVCVCICICICICIWYVDVDVYVYVSVYVHEYVYVYVYIVYVHVYVYVNVYVYVYM